MSRKGNCWDNAVAENFFKILISELIYQITKLQFKQTRMEIFEFIEIWYNNKRKHSYLNYLTPEQFDKLFQSKAAQSIVQFFVANPDNTQMENMDYWSLLILVSSIFSVFCLIVAIKVIPYYTIRLIQKKNKGSIERRTIARVHEICILLNRAPFKDQEQYRHNLSIYTSGKGSGHYRFAGCVSINGLSEILRLKMFGVVNQYFNAFDVELRYEALQKESIRLTEFRNHIENIIGVHSLHIDEEIISSISEICLDIRSFALDFEFNKTWQELFPPDGCKEMPGVSGIREIAKIYQKLLEVLNSIIVKSKFRTELKQ